VGVATEPGGEFGTTVVWLIGHFDDGTVADRQVCTGWHGVDAQVEIEVELIPGEGPGVMIRACDQFDETGVDDVQLHVGVR